MPSQKITFKLSQYQIARGLQIVRALEPSFKLTSLSQLVKVIYTDYLAKMSIGHTDEVRPEIMAEIKTFILTPRRSDISLDSLVDNETKLTSFNPADFAPLIPAETTDSIVSTVTDFSPSPDWDGTYEE